MSIFLMLSLRFLESRHQAESSSREPPAVGSGAPASALISTHIHRSIFDIFAVYNKNTNRSGAIDKIGKKNGRQPIAHTNTNREKGKNNTEKVLYSI